MVDVQPVPAAVLVSEGTRSSPTRRQTTAILLSRKMSESMKGQFVRHLLGKKASFKCRLHSLHFLFFHIICLSFACIRRHCGLASLSFSVLLRLQELHIHNHSHSQHSRGVLFSPRDKRRTRFAIGIGSTFGLEIAIHFID